MTRSAGTAQTNTESPRLGVTARVRETLRSAIAPGDELDIDLTGSATVNAQFWLNRFPLRATAGWTVVAALLSLGVIQQTAPVDWKALALLWLLADPLWGSVWRLAGGRVEMLPLRERDTGEDVWLPYIEDGSPASMVLGRSGQDVLQLVLRVVVPSIVLAIAVAFVLGGHAVWLTVALLVVSMAGWISRHTFGVVPAGLHSGVTIVLPWLLVLTHYGVTGQHEKVGLFALIMAAWFLHNWGESRVLRIQGDVLGALLIVAADIGIALLLVSIKAPMWLAILVVLWLPSWYAIVRRQPMQRLNFWWLLGMLVSAAAIGQ